jgi:hypothetical protein
MFSTLYYPKVATSKKTASGVPFLWLTFDFLEVKSCSQKPKSLRRSYNNFINSGYDNSSDYRISYL